MCEEILLFDVIDFYYHLQIVSRKYYYLTMVSFLMRKSISILLVTSVMIYLFSLSLVPLTRSC